MLSCAHFWGFWLRNHAANGLFACIGGAVLVSLTREPIMLRSFTVKNFRCLEDFEIRNLTRVNLIVGDNNSGKTALLEALFAHRLQSRIIGLLDLKSFRNDHPVTNGAFWLDLFTDMEDSREIVLRSEEHTSELQSLRHLVC